MQRESQTGIKHYEAGDVITLGKGKVLYDVVNEAALGYFHIKSQNTGRVTMESGERFNLVLNVRDNDSEILNQQPEKTEDAPEAEEITTEEIRQNTRTQKGISARKPGPEHIPGETPAEYKERTGKKLDGRTTIYGRMILVGLQLKKNIFSGGGRNANPKRKAVARRAGIKSASDPV